VDGRRDRELAPAHDGTHPGEFDPAVERDNLTSSVGHLQHETRLCRSRPERDGGRPDASHERAYTRPMSNLIAKIRHWLHLDKKPKT
jgi:hypothetical protein